MRVYDLSAKPAKSDGGVDFIDGVNMYGAAILYKRFRQRQQVWRFGLDPEGVSPFVAEYGWRLVEQAGPDYFLATS